MSGISPDGGHAGREPTPRTLRILYAATVGSVSFRGGGGRQRRPGLAAIRFRRSRPIRMARRCLLTSGSLLARR